MKNIGNANITLKHLSFKTIGKRLKKEEALFKFFDRSKIWDFYNIVIVLY